LFSGCFAIFFLFKKEEKVYIVLGLSFCRLDNNYTFFHNQSFESGVLDSHSHPAFFFFKKCENKYHGFWGVFFGVFYGKKESLNHSIYQKFLGGDSQKIYIKDSNVGQYLQDCRALRLPKCTGGTR
jgi:hypothetical protein